MNIFLLQALIIFIINNIWFVFAVCKKRNDIADVAWGLGFIIVALISYFSSGSSQSLLLLILVLFWGLRLSNHILRRFLKKNTEDARYANWRKVWGKNWVIISWLKVFMLQGFFLYVISFPIISTASLKNYNWSYVFLLGLFVWLIGFIFEIIADKQLRTFIQNKENQGKIMRLGLWRYSRHPNYFGESLLWWGIWLITWGSPFFWFNIISPIIITCLLRFVSGVPLAEKGFEGNKDFEIYKQKTPAMFPNFFIK